MRLLTGSCSFGISSLICRRSELTKARSLQASRPWADHRNASKPVRVCCSSNGDGGREEGDGGWSVDEEVDKIFGDEALMQDLNAAVERVARARRELEVYKEQEKQGFLTESFDSTDSLVEACLRDVFAAELDLKNAEIALVKARAGMVDLFGGANFDEQGERLESAKAAGVSGTVGFLAGVPFFSLARDINAVEIATSAAIIFVSCAVFGLTYRYAIRRDLSNTQLRAGCTAAFVLVRCLGQADAAKLFASSPLQDVAVANQLFQVGLFAAESVAIFSFAAVGLEYCFRLGFVSPFPLNGTK